MARKDVRHDQGSDRGNVYALMCVEFDPDTGDVVEMVRPFNEWLYLSQNHRSMVTFSASKAATIFLGSNKCKYCMDLFCKFKSKKLYNMNQVEQQKCCLCAYTIQINLLQNSNETFNWAAAGGTPIEKNGEGNYERSHRIKLP